MRSGALFCSATTGGGENEVLIRVWFTKIYPEIKKRAAKRWEWLDLGLLLFYQLFIVKFQTMVCCVFKSKVVVFTPADWQMTNHFLLFINLLKRESIQPYLQFSSVQSLSCVQLFVTPWTAAHQASLSITNSRSLLKLIESVMPSNHLILCRPLLLLPSIFPSIRVFSNESALRIRWPKYWSFSFNISSSNEYSGLISFRMDWLDLLTVQGSLNLLQYHSSKASILQHPTFFIVHLSHPYMTSGKSIALTRWTFVGKVISAF